MRLRIPFVDIMAWLVFGALGLPLSFGMGYNIMAGRYRSPNMDAVVLGRFLLWPIFGYILVGYYRGLKKVYHRRGFNRLTLATTIALLVILFAYGWQNHPEHAASFLLCLVAFTTGFTYLIHKYPAPSGVGRP